MVACGGVGRCWRHGWKWKCISGGIQLDLADDWEFMANDGDGTGYRVQGTTVCAYMLASSLCGKVFQLNKGKEGKEGRNYYN